MPSVKNAGKSGKPDRNPSRQTGRTIQGDPVSQDPSQAEILKQYGEAVSHIQKGNYAAAHPAFEKLLKTAPPQLIDRIRMYLSACIIQANKPPVTFATPEEQYDYAISLLNNGDYEDARDHLNEIIDGQEDADYAFYGLAVLAATTGDSENCLEKLAVAIQLNSLNRIHARSDSDFQMMADDPRFTDLLYPETT